VPRAKQRSAAGCRGNAFISPGVRTDADRQPPTSDLAREFTRSALTPKLLLRAARRETKNDINPIIEDERDLALA